MSHAWRSSLAAITAQLGEERAVYGIRHGTMRAGLYRPQGVDPQSTHKQDELYIVASGNGMFVKNGERVPFEPQDLLFVEAGADHRFEDFSDDFATWVVFWGPEGGEADR